MKTPITDAFVLDNEFMPKTCDCLNLMSKLETDRAALLDALEFYRKHMLLGYDITDSGQVAESALSAARANFPD